MQIMINSCDVNLQRARKLKQGEKKKYFYLEKLGEAQWRWQWRWLSCCLVVAVRSVLRHRSQISFKSQCLPQSPKESSTVWYLYLYLRHQHITDEGNGSKGWGKKTIFFFLHNSLRISSSGSEERERERERWRPGPNSWCRKDDPQTLVTLLIHTNYTIGDPYL